MSTSTGSRPDRPEGRPPDDADRTDRRRPVVREGDRARTPSDVLVDDPARADLSAAAANRARRHTGWGARWRRDGYEWGPRPPMTAQQRRRRRRLLLGSLPVVVLLVVAALRLLSLNLVAGQTLSAYQAGDRAGTQEWGERQGWVNIVEQFRSPLAIGDAHVLTGDFEHARPWFEQALEEVPKGGIDECKVRVNLGLTYEALGDAAKAKERTTEWKQFYEKGIQTTSQRPPLCDAPEGGRTGEQLRQAQQRMQDKGTDPQQPDTPSQPPGDAPTPQPTPAPQPTPDPDKTPSQEQQDFLEEQQRQNTIERNQQLGEDQRRATGGEGPAYPKPW
jgi:hypothetical protein